MAFIRTIKQENPFTQLDKHFIENDPNISWKAKGLLSYLLSRPDNWQIYYSDLVKRAKDGKESVTSGMAELMAAGYVHRERERKEKGRFGDFIYLVYERPEFNPHTPKPENPDQVENQAAEGAAPKPENPIQVNPTEENTAYNNNNLKDINNNDNNKNQNQYHEPEIDLFSLRIPMAIRQHFKNLVRVLVEDSFNIYDVEEFYNTSPYINTEATKDNYDHVNDFEFAKIIKAAFKNANRPIGNTYGLIKSWTINYLSFKEDNLNGGTVYQKDKYFYNWLD